MSSSRAFRKLSAFVVEGLLLLVVCTLPGTTPVAGATGGKRGVKIDPVFSPTVLPRRLYEYTVLVALNPADCVGNNGLTFSGNGTANISGGGALALGCIAGNGAAGLVRIMDPYLPRGRYINPGNLIWDPMPEYVSYVVRPAPDFSEKAERACTLLPRIGRSSVEGSKETIISPGNYTSITVSDTLTMLPGLYCLTGDIVVESGAHLSGQGVTIFMSGGDFFMAASAEVHLAAPPEGIFPDPLWQRLLLYVDNDHAATVSLAGNSLSSYRGVVYAPASTIEAGGNAEYNAQLIGWNVSIFMINDINLSVDFWSTPPNMQAGKN